VNDSRAGRAGQGASRVSRRPERWSREVRTPRSIRVWSDRHDRTLRERRRGTRIADQPMLRIGLRTDSPGRHHGSGRDQAPGASTRRGVPAAAHVLKQSVARQHRRRRPAGGPRTRAGSSLAQGTGLRGGAGGTELGLDPAAIDRSTGRAPGRACTGADPWAASDAHAGTLQTALVIACGRDGPLDTPCDRRRGPESDATPAMPDMMSGSSPRDARAARCHPRLGSPEP
jgi:hypothetical protein